MPTGSLKKFFDDKGFGFITPDDGSADLFAHKRNFNGNEHDIRDGARVSFESQMDDRSGKPRASTWSVEGGMPGGMGGMSMPMQQPQMGFTRGNGTLKRYFPEKGFGFITCDDGSPDCFAPSRTFKGDESQIRDGMRVTYEAGPDERSGKTRANSWEPDLGGGGMMGMMGGMQGMQMAGGFAPMMGQPGMDNRASPYGGGGMPMAGGLPAGWEMVNDPASGKTYYCNRATGESSWTPPANPMAAAPMQQMQQMQQPAPMQQPVQQQSAGLPAGWESAPDPSSGKNYYFNRATGQTQWDPPQA